MHAYSLSALQLFVCISMLIGCAEWSPDSRGALERDLQTTEGVVGSGFSLFSDKKRANKMKDIVCPLNQSRGGRWENFL